jgi:pimeloyl-ACP methyl ester carboxylesterase
MRLKLLTVLLAAIAMPVSLAAQATEKAPPGVQEFQGKLADGTPYLLRKPANWNGIVLRDLDGVRSRNERYYRMLLELGYGTAGVTRREQDRAWTLNRLHDMQRPQEAVALFRARFGEPKFVIAFGRSAGGSSSLLTSERHPDTVHGAVALCATMDIVGYAGYNMIFEFLYLLKALLAPNDAQLLTHGLPTADTKPYVERWSRVLEEALKTPEGRARVALAFTLTRYPVFGSNRGAQGVAKPDLNDPQSVLNAMVQSAPQIASRVALLSVHSEKDFPPDLPIPGTPVSNPVGNDGVVYADYWKSADPALKRVTEAVYAQANLDLAADLRIIDATPRVDLDRDNMRRGILARGLPTVPVFRMDNLGDQTAPPAMSKLYDRLVAFNGLTDLYRTSYVDASGHCYFKPQQIVAAVEVMRERLQTGKWPDTSAAALNARAGVNDGDGIVFVDLPAGPHAPTWRLEAHSDLFQPATFAKTASLVSRLEYSVKPKEQQELLGYLSAAQKAADQGRSADVNAALDRFVSAVNNIPDRVVRTRLLAAVHQLRTP